MSDYQPDSLDYTPERALPDVVDIIRRKDETPNKMLCIFLHDENDIYRHNFINAGMKASEVVSLLEVTKHRFLRLMDGESDIDRPN